MRSSRLQIWITVVAGISLLGTVLLFALFALDPTRAVVNRPILLTGFILALFLSLVCIAWLLRWLLRPYTQLVGEAKRAPVAHSGKTQNEAAFVLETFQSVIAQLQAQRLELERLSAQASERADSAERFSERIVASMPTALIAFESSGRATVFNGPAQKLFEDGNRTVGDHFRVVFHNVPLLAKMVEDCLSTGKVYRREEIVANNGSGQPKRLGGTVAPIDPSTEPGGRGALCLLTDITEVTQLREQVALKRNLESLGEMSAGLAHEFKNATAALHGYAQFLQSIDHDERGKSAAAALLQEVRSLSDMVTAFLNFARPQPLQLEDVSIEELIAECAHELRPLFNERRVELIIGGESTREKAHHAGAEHAKGPQRLEIHADARMLRQALLNLLRNAAEAIPENNEDRSVRVRTAIEGEPGRARWATISIQDTGKGIPASDLQKIFIPFFTTKATGHGIGLALAHRVITEHGGSLTAANASDGGAVFVVKLAM
jgi:signal transduction histidine kinase